MYHSYQYNQRASRKPMEEVQQKNFKSILLKEKFSDVTFEIGNELFGKKEFHGLRALFAVQSDVLERMLHGNMVESKIENKLIIDDIHPSGFEWSKCYCYGVVVHNEKITYENIGYILQICDKYCMKQCYGIHLNQLSQDFVSNIDHLLHILHVLNQLSLQHIIQDILKTKQFGRLSLHQCRQLLLRDKFYSLPPRVVHLIHTKIFLKLLINIIYGFC